MKFQVTTSRGTKIPIDVNNIDEAEEIANKKYKSWCDIIDSKYLHNFKKEK